MRGCHDYQELLLDHLYDLLEEADRQALLDHLGGCSGCQAALDRARGQQSLLARAARLQFPEVVFAPPAAARPAATVQPAAAVEKPRRSWFALALAASLLLALGGLSVPAYRTAEDYFAAREVVAQHDEAVRQARAQLQEARAELNRAVQKRDEEIAAVHREIKARELRLVVTGPRNVQPGAPADFLVRAVDLNGQPAEAEILARLTDLTPPAPTLPGSRAGLDRNYKLDVADGKLAPGGADLSVTRLEPGTFRVRIPPTVRLQPGQQLGMLVAARKPVSGAEAKDKGAAREQVRVTGQVSLRAPVFLTHLTTDKPMYQPGETVRFRSLTFDRYTLAPVADELRLHYTLTSPTGAIQSITQGASSLVRLGEKDRVEPLNGPDGKPIRGIGAGEYTLDPEIAGGEYTLTVNEETGRFPPVTRKFLVNRYQKPRLDKKLDFNRSSYGAGDEVQARVSALRADGGPVRERPVEITVAIDDRIYDAQGKETGGSFTARTDADGVVLARFRLPAQIERGQASLSVKFDDGAVVETITRTIPLVVKKLDVEFFPEGGDLVAGLPNRVYFQARTPLGKPAQLRGTLFEDGKPLDVKLETLNDDERPGANQGQGVFAFTPRAGKKYEVRIDSPQGIADRKALPTVKADGVVLSVPRGVFEAGDPIRVQVHSTRSRSLMIGAYCRGQLLDTVDLPRGSTEAVLRPTTGVGGVCRITVFEELATGQPQRHLKPVAERLVYRHPKERLDISISPDRRVYVPGQKAKVSIVATSESEKPTPAIALVAVVDQSVLTMADEKTHRTMPTHFLLTTEVRRADELEYADFFVSAQPKAAQALDLLLGTQGWRRFAEQNPAQFRERLRREAEKASDVEKQRREEDAERLLVLSGQSTPQTTDFDQEKLEQVQAEFAIQVEQLQAEHAEASLALAQTANDEPYRAALARLGHFQDRLTRFRDTATPLLTILAVLLGVIGLITALANRLKGAWASLGMAGACALLLIAAWSIPGGPGMPQPTAAPANELAKLMVPAGRAEFEEERAAEAGMIPAPKMAGGGVGGPIPGGFGMMNRPGGMAVPVAPPAMMPGMAAQAAKAMADSAPADDRRNAVLGRGRDLNAFRQNREKQVDELELLKEARGGLAAKKRAVLRDERKLIEGGRRGAFDQAPMNRRPGFPGAKAPEPAMEPLVVREYAHVRSSQTEVGLRSDFTETLYWHPVLMLPDGKGSVSFDLCDSVTSFQVAVQAHTLDGRLGAATKLIESRLPFTLSPRVPTEVTAGDRLDVPVAISNNTSEAREVTLRLAEFKGLDLVGGTADDRLSVAGEGRARRIYGFKPTIQRGTASLVVEGKTAPFAADAIRETIRVVPDGFPVSGSSSDLLEKTATHRLTLPQWIAGTLEVRVDVYPSTLSDLQKGLEGLLREPHGCFEQSSTTNYPNVLILDYLRSTKKSSPEVEKRTRELLDRGYQRLTSFECQDPQARARRGYEWFGGNAPPHEALTAYGLLQFRDMARVHEVDAEMLERTTGYLLAQRDGKGGFKRNSRALDTFGRAPDHLTNAYIVWALTESGSDDVKTELDALVAQAKKSDDPYFLTLVGLGLSNRGRGAEANELLKKVVARQQADGQITGATTSITGSGGRDLVIETTALALLGWLKSDPVGFDRAIRLSARWIGQQRGESGTFGSTQSTILALKSLIAWTKANQRTVEGGELTLYVGEEKVGELRFPAGADGTLTLPVPDPEKLLKPGENRLRVAITGEKNIFPHTVAWTCRTTTPASSKELKVKLAARLSQAQLTEGDPARLQVKMENVSGAPQGMAVAVVGLPAGLNVPEDLKQLKELCKLPEGSKRAALSAFEVQGRELVLYWRDLAKDEVIDLSIDLIARVPGSYRGPASRAYLYYNADHRHWIEPLSAVIAPK